MKYAHSIKLTAFSYGFEDSNSVLGAFLRFFPFSLEDNKIHVIKTQALGFNEKKIEIIEVTLVKSSLINDFLKNMLGNLDESQKNQILQQAESRLDKNLDFFLRFDKESWIKDRRLILTDTGKCFHMRISIAAFPKKREVALGIVNGMFSLK